MPEDTDSIALAENMRIGIKKGRIIIGTKILFFANPNVNAEPKIPIDIKTGDPITNVEIHNERQTFYGLEVEGYDNYYLDNTIITTLHHLPKP